MAHDSAGQLGGVQNRCIGIFLTGMPYLIADEEDKKNLVRDQEPDEYASTCMPVLAFPVACWALPLLSHHASMCCELLQ